MLMVCVFRSGDAHSHQRHVWSRIRHHGEGGEADALQAGQPLQTGGPVQLGPLWQRVPDGNGLRQHRGQVSPHLFTLFTWLILVAVSREQRAGPHPHPPQRTVLRRGLSLKPGKVKRCAVCKRLARRTREHHCRRLESHDTCVAAGDAMIAQVFV